MGSSMTASCGHSRGHVVSNLGKARGTRRLRVQSVQQRRNALGSLATWLGAAHDHDLVAAQLMTHPTNLAPISILDCYGGDQRGPPAHGRMERCSLSSSE